MQQTTLRVIKLGGITVLDVNGQKFDAAFAMHLRKEVQPLLKEGAQFVLNLEDVNFMDSTGLGAIVYLQKKVYESAFDKKFLKLSGVKTEINRLFQLARMDKVFLQHETVNDALEEFGLVDKYMEISR